MHFFVIFKTYFTKFNCSGLRRNQKNLTFNSGLETSGFISLLWDHALRISEFLGGEGGHEIRIFSDIGGKGGQGNSDIRIFEA